MGIHRSTEIATVVRQAFILVVMMSAQADAAQAPRANRAALGADTVATVTRSQCPNRCIRAVAIIFSDGRVVRSAAGARVRETDTVSVAGGDTIYLTPHELLGVRVALDSLQAAFGAQIVSSTSQRCTAARPSLTVSTTWRDSAGRHRIVEFHPTCAEAPLAVREFGLLLFQTARLNRWRPAMAIANEDLRVQWIPVGALADRDCRRVAPGSAALREQALRVFRDRKGRACLYAVRHSIEGDSVRTYLLLDYVDSRIALAVKDHPADPNGTVPAYRIGNCRRERAADAGVVIVCDYSEFSGQLRW